MNDLLEFIGCAICALAFVLVFRDMFNPLKTELK